jgi:HK97 family phage major capsid protein
MSSQIRSLEARRAAALQAARGLHDTAAAANRDLTAEEAAAYEKHMADASGAKVSIDRLRALELEEAGLRADGTVDIGAARTIKTKDNAAEDPRHGFRAFGEFAGAVAKARLQGVQDQRLRIGAAAPGTVAVETNGADGGFAIPPEFSSEIWRLSLGEGSLLPQTANTETGSNSMAFPKDESTPWGTDGVRPTGRRRRRPRRRRSPKLSMQTLPAQADGARAASRRAARGRLRAGRLPADEAPSRLDPLEDERGDPVRRRRRPAARRAQRPAAVVRAKESGQATARCSR